MTTEDLEFVVAMTGHAPYRKLTNPSHPGYDPGYEEWITQEAQRLRSLLFRPGPVKPRVPLGTREP